MAEIRVLGDRLIVHVTGLDRTLALKSRLEFPLDHVVRVSKGVGQDDGRGWLKLVGARLPRVLEAGTFHSSGKRVFWDVRDRDRAIAIDLRDEKYARLVIQVADPDATAEAILEAAGQSPASRHPSAFRRDMAGELH